MEEYLPKWQAALAAFVFVLTVAGCSGNPPPGSTSQTGEPSTATPPGTVASSSEPTKAAGPDTDVSASRGEQVARANACTACHSVTGDVSVGPAWKGLFGSQQVLTDGSSTLVDEAFLVESIKSPDAKVADGFSPGIMPRDFGQKLTDADISSLVEYIKSLE